MLWDKLQHHVKDGPFLIPKFEWRPPYYPCVWQTNCIHSVYYVIYIYMNLKSGCTILKKPFNYLQSKWPLGVIICVSFFRWFLDKLIYYIYNILINIISNMLTSFWDSDQLPWTKSTYSNVICDSNSKQCLKCYCVKTNCLSQCLIKALGCT